MYHYLYQIVSMVPDENGVCKVYSGIHSDELPPEQDDYFGSGIWISRAVEKYGRDKFVKTIVAQFDTREEAYACETQWLEKLFYKLYDGCWEKFNRHHYNLRLNEGSRDGGSFSDETRKRMSVSRTGKFSGENSPRYGTTGEGSPKFKGIVVGTCLRDGKQIVFSGNKSIKDRSFNTGHIASCLNGNRPHHKNFTFIRTTDEEFLLQLLEEDNFHDEQSKQIIQNYLQR